MESQKIFIALSVAVLLAAPAFAQFPGTGGGGGSSQSASDEQRPNDDARDSRDSRNDQGDDASSSKHNGAAPEQWELPPTELDLPVDEKVHVHVEPYVAGSVVDRVSEPAAVTVTISEPTSMVEVFVVPVDSPYGGKALDKPRLIGKDDKPADGFKVMWTGKEKAPYVKVFAVVMKRAGVQRRWRSHTLDFGMGGMRLDAAAGGGPPAASTTTTTVTRTTTTSSDSK
jgi:hypothetical protein